MGFKKAQRQAQKVKIAFQGASGSGKTRTAIGVMTELLKLVEPGKRIAFVDSENSADVYAPPFDFDRDNEFGTPGRENYHPDKLIEKLETARKDPQYGGVIVDSLTYFWKEPGGLTTMIDAICDAQRAKGKPGDSFAAWKTVDPIYRRLMNYIRNYPLHLFVCVRSKQAYDRSEKNVKKLGLEPEFRDGYEFYLDAQFAIDADHIAVPLKHRMQEYLEGKIFRMEDLKFAEQISDWLNAGAPGQQDTVSVPELVVAPEPEPMPEPEPTSITPEVASEALGASLLSALNASNSNAELTAVAARVQDAKKDKLVSELTLEGLKKAFARRAKELKEQAA